MRILIAPVAAFALCASLCPAAIASPSSDRRAMVRAVEKFVVAENHLNPSFCKMLTSKARQSYAVWLRILVDTPKVDCALGVKAYAAIAPPDRDPQHVAQMDDKIMAALRAGRAKNSGRKKGTVTVRYSNSGCPAGKDRQTFALERSSKGRWLIAVEGDINGRCFSRPASSDETTAIQAAIGGQLTAWAANDASGYCAQTDIVSLRPLVSLFKLNTFSNQELIGFHFDQVACVDFFARAWSQKPVQASSIAPYAAALSKVEWVVVGGQAISTLAPTDNADDFICFAAVYLGNDIWRAAVTTHCDGNGNISSSLDLVEIARRAWA